MAVTITPAGATIAVEVAWGADLTAADTSWTWTDVTTDVRLGPGIDTSMGRSDEASTTQPASLTLTLDNAGGKYSLGPQSPNYPYVRRGTPVRIRVKPTLAGSYTTVFQGGAVGWEPDWTLRGNVAEVKLEVAGTLRRLGQGASPTISSIKRALASQSSIVAYWSCEDGKLATRFAPTVGTNSMTWSGSPALASNSDFLCSDPLPVLKGAVFYGDVLPYTPLANGEVTVRALVSFPTTTANGSVILRGFTSGTIARADLVYVTGGNLELRLYDRADTLLYTINPTPWALDGTRRRVSFTLKVTGGFVEAGINTLEVGGGEIGFGAVTTIASTPAALGTMIKVVVNPSRSLTDTAIGHISVETGSGSLSALSAQLNANIGEDPTNRMLRLCAENNVPFSYQGFADGSTSILDSMGAQTTDTLLALLRETEHTAQGVLYDGVSSGLF